MRIVHIVESFGGGVFDFLVDLTNNLIEYEHVIIYGVRENTPNKFQNCFLPSTKFIQWKHANREVSVINDILAFFYLTTVLQKLKPVDVIHLHSSKAGFIGRIVCRLLLKHHRVVYTAHGVSFLRTDVSPSKVLFFKKLEQFGFKMGGIVVACSESERKAFATNNINAICINNGVSIQAISITKDKAPKNSHSIVIGTIGRLSKQKNPHLFNEIAGRFIDNRNVSFIWIGDGELRTEIQFHENVSLTGWLTQDQVLEELDKVDIYVSTSLWEGLPISVLQAMSCQKPLVLSECIGNIDLVIEGVNGYLFKSSNEAKNYIEQLIADRKFMDILGAGSKKLLEDKFSLQSTVDNYKSLYGQIGKTASTYEEEI